MSYLTSSQVTVFPTANRSTEYRRDARAFTEVTVTDVRKEVCDHNSYVIYCEHDTNKTGIVDWTSAEASSTKDLYFVIGGYRFSVNTVILRTAANTLGGNNLYGNIIVTDGMISGTDLNGNYTGLDLGTTASGTYSLLLLKKIDNTWYIPAGSYKKNGDSGSTLELDGGYFNYDGTGSVTGYDLNNNPIQ